MSMIYKILFEVNMLHEYFLTRSGGENIFDQSEQADRNNYLAEEFENERINIHSVLKFEIAQGDQEIFNQYKLRLLPTFTGFKIAMAVNKQTNEGGVTSYQPANVLPDNLFINITITKKTPQIEQITNTRLYRNFDSSWFFTNENVNGSKIYPFLTQPVSTFDPTRGYEQGELVQSGNIRRFYREANGNVAWLATNGSGFANENDRMVVSNSFYYSFNSPNTISSASFKLIDSNNEIVESLSFSGGPDLRKVYLQFTEEKLVSVNKGSFYTLLVEENGAYRREHRIGFQKNADKCWGIISIKPKVSISAFGLLDESGFLKTRKTVSGIFDPPAPLFEIPFSSRLTFWRYANNRTKTLITNLFPTLLYAESGKLISKIPRPLTLVSTIFGEPYNPLYLPNPKPGDAIRIENNKIYSDILVPESKDLFPIQV
jgi:hypothetical protein